MSCDFGVWFPYQRLTADEAGALYGRLCDRRGADATQIIPAHAAVDAFYAALTAKWPELSSMPPGIEHDVVACPWSCKTDHSPAHVITSCVWSQAAAVYEVMRGLANQHGLVLYNPQDGEILYPGEERPDPRPGLPDAEGVRNLPDWDGIAGMILKILHGSLPDEPGVIYSFECGAPHGGRVTKKQLEDVPALKAMSDQLRWKPEDDQG